MRALTHPGGLVALIAPTGLIADYATRRFTDALLAHGELVFLYDFENKGIFPKVASKYKFSLLLLKRQGGLTRVEAGFFLLHPSRWQASQLNEHLLVLSPADIQRLNPNTRTFPILRSARDLELLHYVYARFPVLVEEAKGPQGSPWGVRFLRMFDMTNDSHLFVERKQTPLAGANGQVQGVPDYLPLYEAKFIHQFDHRFATYVRRRGKWVTEEVPAEQKADAAYTITLRYWVPAEEVEHRLQQLKWHCPWLLGFRLITRPTDERTLIASVLPTAAVGNSLALLLLSRAEAAALLLATLNSFVVDYVARQKVGGVNFSQYHLYQLPVVPPERFREELPWGETVGAYVRERVLELVYTSWAMEPFAREMGYGGPPFRWEEARRRQLRVELEAVFLWLYLGPPDQWEAPASEALRRYFPTPREAAQYILAQFPIVQRREEKAFGSYRLAEEILGAYRALSEVSAAKRERR